MQHCLLFNVSEFAYLARSPGIYRIATWLRQNDFDVEVIDWANHWTIDELIYLFQSRYNSNTKFIGFSHLFSIWNDTLEQLCQWIKINYPDLPIISGSSVNPMFQSQHIDFYIQGFGEKALLNLLQWILNNGPRPRFDLKKINNKPLIKANDHYQSFPMQSLLIEYQQRDFLQTHEWVGIETARGCKFQCKFCNFPVLGVKGDYSRDAADFEQQLRDTYDRFGITHYTIVDETFNDSTEKISKFADVVQQLNFDTFFSAYIRADLMISRPHDKEELLRMNVLGHFYGIETFNHRSAQTVNKGMPSERLKIGLIDAKKYFQSHGSNLYRGSLGLIVGLPYETMDSLESTRLWLIDNWTSHSYTIYPLSIPGDELHRPSQFSIDYKKYGYTVMPSSVTTESSSGSSKTIGIHTISWQNDHMNFLDANRICESFVQQKLQHDFRPSCFSLAHKLKQPYSVKDKISLKYDVFYQERDSDLSKYINAKLNHK